MLDKSTERETDSLFRDEFADHSFDATCFVIAVCPMPYRTLLINDEVRREAHVEIAVSIPVGVLEYHTEAVRDDLKPKRVLAKKARDLLLILH